MHLFLFLLKSSHGLFLKLFLLCNRRLTTDTLAKHTHFAFVTSVFIFIFIFPIKYSNNRFFYKESFHVHLKVDKQMGLLLTLLIPFNYMGES